MQKSILALMLVIATSITAAPTPTPATPDTPATPAPSETPPAITDEAGASATTAAPTEAAAATPTEAETPPTKATVTPAAPTIKSLENKLIELMSDDEQPKHREMMYLKLNAQLTKLGNQTLAPEQLTAQLKKIDEQIAYVAQTSYLHNPVDITAYANGHAPLFASYIFEALEITNSPELKGHPGPTPGSNLFIVGHRQDNTPILSRVYASRGKYDKGIKYDAKKDKVWAKEFGPAKRVLLGTPEQILKDKFIIDNPLPSRLRTILDHPTDKTAYNRVFEQKDGQYMVYRLGNLAEWMVKVDQTKITIGQPPTLAALGIAIPAHTIMTSPHIMLNIQVMHQPEKDKPAVAKTFLMNANEEYQSRFNNYDGKPAAIAQAYIGFGYPHATLLHGVYSSVELDGASSLLWYTDPDQAHAAMDTYHQKEKARREAEAAARAAKRMADLERKRAEEGKSGERRVINDDGSFSLYVTDDKLGYKDKLLGWFTIVSPERFTHADEKTGAMLFNDNFYLTAEHVGITPPAAVNQDNCKLLYQEKPLSNKGPVNAYLIPNGYYPGAIAEDYGIATDTPLWYGFGIDLEAYFLNPTEISNMNQIMQSFNYSRYIYDADIIKGYEMRDKWLASGSPTATVKNGKKYEPESKKGFKEIGAGFAAIGKGFISLF